MSNTQGPVGAVLTGIAHYSTQNPFLNQFKQATPWLPQKFNVWDTGKPLNLDGNGWVTSIPQGPNAAYDYATSILLPFGQAVRSGKYIVFYEGQGKLEYGQTASKLTGQSQPGRDVLQVTRNPNDPLSGPFSLSVTRTNPNDYIRNIKVYHQDDLPLAELGLKFTPKFLRNLRNFETLRSLNWQNINGSTEASWSDRARMDDATWAQRGAPIELIIELANQTGTNPWIHIPTQADDDYVRQMAQYVRQHLNPNLKFHVEWGNESWNRTPGFTGEWAFQQAATRWAGYWQRLANQRGQSVEAVQESENSWIQYSGVRTAEIAQIWTEVFGSSANRMDVVFSNLAVVPSLAEKGLTAPAWADEQRKLGVPENQIKRPKQFIDAVGVAFYLGLDMGTEGNAAIVKSWLSQPDGGFARAFEFLSTGGYTNANGQFVKPWQSFETVAAMRPLLQKQMDLVKKHGLKLVSYEGGQSLRTSFGTLYDDPALNNFFIAMNRRPEMQALYEEYLDTWNQITGGALLTHYTDVGPYSRYGSWGLLPRWNVNNSPKFQAVDNYSNSNNNIGFFQQGNAGNNNLVGSDKSDTLLGGQGSDVLSGFGGVDYLHGGIGVDTIVGGAGGDFILGGVGADNLTGESGADRFLYARRNDGVDTINDFNTTEGDQIWILSTVFTGLSGQQGKTGRIVNGNFGTGNTRAAAAQQARNANGGQAGSAILAVAVSGGVQIWYDRDTSTTNSESLLATLSGQNLSNITTSQIRLYDFF